MADSSFPAYKPYDPNTTKSKYDVLRTRARQDANTEAQQNVGALQRRFAAQGMVNSGEAIKQEQLAREASDKSAEAAGQNIDFAQAQEQQGAQDAENQRAFAREERLGGQQFQAGEAEKQRGFSKDLFDKDMAFKQKQQAFTESSFAQEFKEKQDQFGATYYLEKDAQNFNEDVARGKYDKKSLMDQLSDPQNWVNYISGGYSAAPGNAKKAGKSIKKYL